MVDLTKNKNFFILPLLLSIVILVSVKINYASDKFILNAERIKFNYFSRIVKNTNTVRTKYSIK